MSDAVLITLIIVAGIVVLFGMLLGIAAVIGKQPSRPKPSTDYRSAQKRINRGDN